MANDFPEVRDQSTLTGVFNTGQFFTIGVEGEMASSGTEATLGLPETITSAEDAETAFGDAPLTDLVKFILGRGVNSVVAVASDDATPDLAARQDAWEALADDPRIRLRLTDAKAQAVLVALATSCEDADEIQNKQIAFGALTSPTVKADLSTAAAAIASKRAVLLGPGVYDPSGDLFDGQYVAALAACEVARNPDIADSLNLATIAATTGVEKEAATGLPIFRLRSNSGSPINDFQDLLDDGVSPLMQGADGRAAFTHLRMTYTTDDTHDALMTPLIKDEVFIGLRTMLTSAGFLRVGNTAINRAHAARLTEKWLTDHNNWVEPVELGSGEIGYGVTIVAAEDLKSFAVNYFGQVVRGNNVIVINGTLTIPTAA